MYAVTISMRAKDPDAFRRLERASLAVAGPSLLEPGCLFFDVLTDEADPLLLRFYEAYVDKPAFEAHLRAPHTTEWSQECIPLVDRSSIRLPESATRRTVPVARRVVVFGATGNIGSEMVKLLARDPRCQEIRALTRDPHSASAQRLAAMDQKVKLRAFKIDELENACAGTDGAFVVAPLSEDMAAWHQSVARGLVAAGIEHVVKVSVTGARAPESDPPPGRFPSLHFAGEEALRHAGLTTTVIRPTIFMQHFEMNTGLYVRGDDRVFLPTSTAGVAFLDCRDIAVFGQELLLSPAASSFRGGAHELTGPEALTGTRIAEILSHVRERATLHVDGEAAFVARCAELGLPDWAKFVYAEAAGGWFSALSTTVFEAVVGRKPRGFAAYADDHALWFTP